MPLPVTFGNLTVAHMSDLDTNFTAVALYCWLPCSIAGTNTLTLTLRADSVTLSAYADLLTFSGIASATNTGATTAQVGSLPVLQVYKDTTGGPVPLTGGEIHIHNCIFLVYDSQLNSGAGGFHLKAPL